MGLVVTLLAVIGFFVIVKFIRNGYSGVQKLNYMNELIKRYDGDCTAEASINHLLRGKPSTMETIPADIYKWCMSHSPERNICAQHRATQDDFYKIFTTLCLTCPATIKGFFVPISAFFFYPTLDYVLKNKGSLNSRRVSDDLCTFFERQ